MIWSRGTAACPGWSVLFGRVLLGLILVIPSATPAQPAFTWAQGAGGADADSGNGVTVDSSGNAYVAGDFESATMDFGGTTLTNAGQAGSTANAFIAKY